MLLNRLGFQTGCPRQLLKRIPTPIHSSCHLQCVIARSMMSQVEDARALRPAAQKLSIYLPRDKKNRIDTHLLALVRIQVLTRSPSKYGRTLTLVVPPYKLHRVLVLARHASHHHARILYKSSILHLRSLHISTNAPNPIPTHRSNRSPCGNTLAHLRHIITRGSPTDLTSGRCTSHRHAKGSRTTSLTVVWSISMGHQLRRSRNLYSSAC